MSAESIDLSSLSGANRAYLEGLRELYDAQPDAVPAAWAAFFSGLSDGAPTPTTASVRPAAAMSHPSPVTVDPVGPDRQAAVDRLVAAYRHHGHLAATLDPLGLKQPDRSALQLDRFGLGDADLDRTFTTDSRTGVERGTLREILAWLDAAYTGTLGVELEHVQHEEAREWLRERIEAPVEPMSKADQTFVFSKLFAAENFESFLAKKFTGKKRFSLEGGETLIPMLAAVVESAGDSGVTDAVLGMAHRGRLNVMANLMNKPAGQIFAEFEEAAEPDLAEFGDVKYHLGFSNNLPTRAGGSVHVSLAFNPSHLEPVYPIVEGSVRARQTILGDRERRRVMPIVIHGDAAFPGQGVVSETLNLAYVDGYRTGGTVHLIVNNQIGFTTMPYESRSTRYATDLAKVIGMPVFHLNGDDPETACRVAALALEYRQRFGSDVMLDLVCYRRLGHNETDEPMFTQPVMYGRVKNQPSSATIYEGRLLESGAFTREDLDAIKAGVRDALDQAYAEAQSAPMKIHIDTLKGRWDGLGMAEPVTPVVTTLSDERFRAIGSRLVSLPDGFTPHRGIARILQNRKQMIESDAPIDWASAEALAFGSLLTEGTPIRLTGQDSGRGTFSHRHAVMSDMNSEAEYTPLCHLGDGQASFEVINSTLSEFACLGFEFGYSLADPTTLVIWEAQFGDFVNGAQVIIDQFISSSEAKWQRLSGLVMLLPHGYEGQGPEHSSARLERFLQLCATDNLRVANCTTPAQYFHLLRRQMHRSTRKPLIIMSPKSLLRHPLVVSTKADLTEGSFQPVLDDPGVEAAGSVERVVLCSGKVFYDLLEARQKEPAPTVALVRIERLYPFPEAELKTVLERYPAARELCWVQEEPKNQGAWQFVRPLIESVRSDLGRLRYIGRAAGPSPATGFAKTHQKQQARLVAEALKVSAAEVQADGPLTTTEIAATQPAS